MRKLTPLLWVTAATAGIVVSTMLPFFPGRYDSVAVPLSVMCQLFGIVGLLLVPVGALWIASGHWNRLAGMQGTLAIAALVVTSIVWFIVSLAALALGGFLLGAGAVAPWIYVVSRALTRLRHLQSAAPPLTSAMPLCMVIVPVAVLLLQQGLAGPATEFSRSRAIRNSAPLIADIERYRETNGRYPESLLSVSADYLPGVIGIKEYLYEPSGDTYNLVFEHSTFRLGTREFVVYNPHDQQVMTSHKNDLLRLTPEGLALERTRGHYAVHEAPHAHWKYFWFD